MAIRHFTRLLRVLPFLGRTVRFGLPMPQNARRPVIRANSLGYVCGIYLQDPFEFDVLVRIWDSPNKYPYPEDSLRDCSTENEWQIPASVFLRHARRCEFHAHPFWFAQEGEKGGDPSGKGTSGRPRRRAKRNGLKSPQEAAE